MLSDELKMEDIFNKKYKVTYENDFRLPEKDKLFSSDPWEDQGFQGIKTELNNQKSRLNHYDLEVWQQHTYHTRLTKFVTSNVKSIIAPELLTLAWLKFHECLMSFPLVSERILEENRLMSLHLSEAPGAFVTSMNHFMKSNHGNVQWNWMASTMNPYYEGNSSSVMISDDRFIKHTLDRWNFGFDNTGDLMIWNNSQNIIEEVKKIGNVHLITADGSIDCSFKPEEQEGIVASLHFCETITALQILSEGGSFVLKLFTLFEHYSINLIYLLSKVFDEIHFFKPPSSKGGNSEIYTICLNYRGFDCVHHYVDKFKKVYGESVFFERAMFSYDILPKSFISTLFDASLFFFNHQYSTIDENIFLFESNPNKAKSLQKKLNWIQNEVKKEYFRRYNLRPIDEHDRLCGDALFNTTTYRRGLSAGSFEDRQNAKSASRECRRANILKWLSDDYYIDFSIPVRVKCDTPPVVLTYSYGKAYDKLNSSGFVEGCIFDLYKELSEERSEEVDISDFHSIIISDRTCTVKFGRQHMLDRHRQWENSCFQCLKNALSRYTQFDRLILKDYDASLTRLGAGVLYAVSVSGFDSITFDGDSTIRLDGFRCTPDAVLILNRICEAERSSRQPFVLLEVVSLKILLSESFGHAIRKYNTFTLYERLLKFVQ